MYLHKMDDPYTFPSAFEKSVDIGKTNPIMLLDTIHNIGFADKEKNSQQTLGASQNIYNYWINAKGIRFIESISGDNFKDKPYSYYLKLEEKRKSVIADREGTDHKLKQVTLENIGLYKKLALGSFIVAIVAIIAPVFISKINDHKTIKTESTTPQLNKILESSQQQEKVLKDILDSLRKI